MWAAGALLLASAAILLLLSWHRPTARLLRGDESTYVLMAWSLARDGDLHFTLADRWAAEQLGPETSVILQRKGDTLAYSKPILFPLLLAPFFALFGLWGAVLLNLLVLGSGTWLLLRALAAGWGVPGASRAIATLLGAGSALAWVGWRMSEAVQLGLALAACGLLVTALGRPEPAGRFLRAPAFYAGILCGAFISLREPNAALWLGLVVSAAFLGGRRIASALAFGGVTAYALLVLLTVGLTGSPWPYKAERTTFSAETGWPVGPQSEGVLDRFERDASRATSSLGFFPHLSLDRSAYASLYFLLGRHTGLLLYAPGALLLWLLGLCSPRTRGWLLGPLALALFYLLWLPENYFGGETFVGNRYILPALAFLPLGLARPPSWKALAPAWVVAVLAGASAWVSEKRAMEEPPTSQLHAYAGVFRWLPYESTAQQIDGRRDRYWSEEFVRFVDPFALVGPWSFELISGSPPAEVLLARHGQKQPLLWLVVSDGPARLVWRDWARRRSIKLEPTGSGAYGGWAAIRLAPPWRMHRFWWDPEAFYDVFLARFWLEAPQSGTRARVRYLGGQLPPDGSFQWKLQAASVPEGAPAGSTVWLPLRLENHSSFSWQSEAVLPVQLGTRIWDGEGQRLQWEGRTPLPQVVPPGQAVAATARLVVPSQPGRYRVEVDLVMEDVTWFAAKTGKPILAFELRVGAEGAGEALPGRPFLPVDTPLDPAAGSPRPGSGRQASPRD